MRSAAVSALVGLAILASTAAGSPPEKPVAKFYGSWKVASLEEDGQKLTDDDIAKLRVIIRGESLFIEDGPEKEELRLQHRPEEGARAYDLASPDGKVKIKAIIELDGETLKIAGVDRPNAARPSDFVSKPGSGVGLLVLQRTADSSAPTPKK